MKRFKITLLILLLLYVDTMILEAERYQKKFDSGKIVVIENKKYSRCFVSTDADYYDVNHEIVALEGFFSYFNGNEKPIGADISIDSDFRRGDVIAAEVTTIPEVNRVRSVLRDEKGGEVSRNQFFRVNDRWVGFLGIPSYIRRGDYKLDISGWDETRHFIFTRKVTVGGKAFPLDVIKLNETLTSLRERDDRRIREETQKLLSIIRSFDSNAVFAYSGFVFPVRGRITGHFGDRRRYIYSDGAVQSSIHNGIDIAVQIGTEVHACADGRVVLAEKRILTGKSVIIEHFPGVFSLYYHLNSIRIKAGDMVKKGEIIGYSGMSGLATGPHLHWEIRVSGVAVDPEPFLEGKVIDKNIFISSIGTQNISGTEGR